MITNNSTEQLKIFLKEMFQFNANDLDFGIYKIYNLKRKEIENFIDGQDKQCLEPIINETLQLVSNIEKQVELTSLTAYLKKFNQESLVNDPTVGHSQEATQEVKKLGIENFTSPKPVKLIKKVVHIGSDFNSVVLDFFAGSGTTANAIIKLNKDLFEAGKRKYILVEMGTYFETVTKPRIQKVIYSDNWKDGKPLDNNGSPKHIFKYLTLEQYEDVLDAITPYEGETPKNLPLKYLYKPELNKINSTLNIGQPFANQINYGQPSKQGYIDLVDTYNHLQGYEVKSIRVYTISNKYFKVIKTASAIIIWRDVALGEDDSEAIIKIAEKYPEVTAIEVNYDFNILATLKNKQLQVGNRLLDVKIISADVFNQ